MNKIKRKQRKQMGKDNNKKKMNNLDSQEAHKMRFVTQI